MKTLLRYIVLIFLMFISQGVSAQNSVDVLEQDIYLPKRKASVYTLLNEISRKSGMLFIYDSKLIDNERIVRIAAGKRKVNDAIYEVIGSNSFILKRVGRHIMVTAKDDNNKATVNDSLVGRYIVLEGKLTDGQSNEAIAYGSIGIVGSSVGTISNQNGFFRLIYPAKLQDETVCFSHLGYEPQQIPLAGLAGRFSNISLQIKTVPLPEVVIHAVDPIEAVARIRKNISRNYSPKPVNMLSFYREGIDYNGEFKALTEAVVELYKSSYKNRFSSDQVHLLKMRKITNFSKSDTLIAKMSSGIDASFKLDVIKDLPDFLFSDNIYPSYNYRYVESTVIDGKDVDVISFWQRDEVVEPHYAGKLYIDCEDNSLVRVEMHILPKMVREATDMFVSRQAQSIKLTASRIEYAITYRKIGDRYYINHVRGDLYFKAKRRKRLFGSSKIHTWFEMIQCKTDTVNVRRFNKSERISATTVFSETPFDYDSQFWGEYNSIPLEERITDVIRKLSPKIEISN